MKKGTTSRSLKLFGLAARVGTSEMAQSIKSKFSKASEQLTAEKMSARLDQAKWIAENLSQMKGAAMKVGQLLSIDGGDHFPPEAMAVLAKLQSSAEPVDFDIVREVLVEDIGEKKLGDFDDLSIIPDAAASIGQVHRASLKGRAIAIKIQYPGIAESIESDLKILRRLAKSLMSLSSREIDLTELFKEFQRVLEQEADYRVELELMTEYRANLLKAFPLVPGEAPLYRVPQAIPEYSGRRVLTMSWEEGVGIDTWLKSQPSVERRERVARSLLGLFGHEFFDWGLVQTDPNFANFLIAPDDALVLLDFGAALRYEEEFRIRYRNFLGAMGSLDAEKIVREGEAFGLISERESADTKRLFAELLINSVEPFFASKQPFQFDDSDYAKRSRDAGQRFARSLQYSPPPQRILFLHRKLGGIFNFVKKLDVRIDLTPYWKKMVGDGLPPA
ncbi:AarF/ABC1/UbiB kinase family protein [soil metagenome]